MTTYIQRNGTMFADIVITSKKTNHGTEKNHRERVKHVTCNSGCHSYTGDTEWDTQSLIAQPSSAMSIEMWSTMKYGPRESPDRKITIE